MPQQPAQIGNGVLQAGPRRRSNTDWPRPGAMHLELRMMRGLSGMHGDQIVSQRNNVLLRSFDDFTRRTGLPASVLRKLSNADGFGSLQLNRRESLWHSLPERKPQPLFAGVADEEPAVPLLEMSLQEQIVADYRSGGLPLLGHPLQFVRDQLEEWKVVMARELACLPVTCRYRVAGLVLLRQRPGTAKGITFVTIEDETGTANLIVRQEVWERHRTVAAGASAVIAHGRLQRQDSVIHLLVDRLGDLSQLLAGVNARSRDFD